MDLPFGVDFHMRRGNDFRRKWEDLGTGQDDAIKIQLDPPLAYKVSGILIILEVATQFRTSRKYRMPEGRHMTEIAKHRITDLRSLGREVGFIYGALQKCSGGDDLIAGRSSGCDVGRNPQQKEC